LQPLKVNQEVSKSKVKSQKPLAISHESLAITSIRMMKWRIFMHRVISWLQNVFVRVILTLSIVGIAFLVSAAVDYGNSFQAQAEPLTPEATKYQVNSDDSPFREDDQEKVNALFKENKQPQTSSESTQELGESLTKPQKTIKKNLDSAADNIREKLNLDQPIYPGTKDFLNDAPDKAQ
jgi:hypothetical protein